MKIVEDALAELLVLLGRSGYDFVPVTPATHARVIARPLPARPTLRDIFGWNRPFRLEDIEPVLLRLLERCDALKPSGPYLRSAIRVARLGPDLLIHSSYPTSQADAVFLGPDTYRFARLLRDELGRMERPGWILDVGAGSGAGGIVAGRHAGPARLTLMDCNPKALAFARVNARVAGMECETLHASRIPDGPDLIIANPPYLMDGEKRAYRDGGTLLGGAVALDWAKQSLSCLPAGGRMLLYTGAAFVDGRAPLAEALSALAREENVRVTLWELDPDMFGEELESSAYADVERIAAIAARIEKA